MVWDILALQRVHHHKGHEIRVQKTSFVHRMQYGLAVDGVKQDQLDALAGMFSLHGTLTDNGSLVPVEVIVKQGFFTGEYFCRIDGTTIRMKRYTVEDV